MSITFQLKTRWFLYLTLVFLSQQYNIQTSDIFLALMQLNAALV